MRINLVHSLNIRMESFTAIQNHLLEKINLINNFSMNNIKKCAGVDVSYWEDEGIEWGACSIFVIDYETKGFIEKQYSVGKIFIPYIPGYLAFRELPLVIKAAKKLSITPDLFIFDGNGYLHPRHMGIATHASFFLNRPTIGVAKNYFKVHDIDFEMPSNEIGSFEDIIIDGELSGRVLRSHKGVKPIFISCGNYIDLQTTTEVTLNLISNESRLPIPIRLADLETRQIRKRMQKEER